jgi:AAA domain-containing protein
MTAKAQPDINDTLRDEGLDVARERHDQAWANKGNGHAKTFRFQVKPFEAIKLSTEPNYRVVGILPRVGLVVVWGPPKCGKSFWTFDLVMHIALGWKYRGRKVQQGMVVYLALEGGPGFAARKEAWRQRHLADHKELVPFNLIDVPVDLIADHKTLIEEIEAQVSEMPAIVVIDTLNRSLNGSENKDEDMGKYIRAADTIRARFGCLVIIIHHCGVAGGRPRGHTSLTGADDAQIAVIRDKDGEITVTVEHMKDGEASAPMGSKLETVTVGINNEGDPITSCIIVPAEIVDKKAKAKKQRGLPGGAQLALDLLQKLMTKKGEVPPADENIPPDTKVCTVTEWREYFYNAYADDGDKGDKSSRKAREKAFLRATLTLQNAKLVGIWSNKAWLGRQRRHLETFEEKPEKMSPEAYGDGSKETWRHDHEGDGDITHPRVMSPVSMSPSSVSPDGIEEEPITDDERQQLRERGFAECDILAFTPAQARNILNPRKPFPFRTVPDPPPKGHPCVHCLKTEGRIILVTEPGTLHHHHPLHMECAAEFFAKRKEPAKPAPSRTAKLKSDDLPYADPVVEVPDLGPDALDEHGVPRGGAKTAGPPLTQGQARDLAEQYHDRAVAEHNTSPTGDVDSEKLDAWLRASLRAEVPPELVEAAFKQVMQLVFAV